MYIRSVRLADLLFFGRLRRQTFRLNLPDSLVTGFSPTRAAIASALPIGSGVRTFILGDERPQAFIQAATRDRGHCWDILCLGAAGNLGSVDNEGHAWVRLLHSTALAAGRRRATRLLAKVPETAPELACFRHAGYTAYAREAIYSKILTEADCAHVEASAIRPQGGSDAWLVHRLYFLSVPRPVQDAEAHVSAHWELRKARPGGLREQGWLMEDGAETSAYARTLSRWGNHAIELLFDPSQRHVLPQLVAHTLARLPAAPGDRVYCTLPEYQSEAEEVLLAAGFHRSGTQALLVKYLAVKANARERLFAPVSATKAGRLSTYAQRAERV